ncbi:MAG: methylmalonyl Co-A mutase-associated GTPase MeaB [Thermomicrobiales bacterium]|nr:methylmalonyl Co-A mutase-associated GTPase MeaB [Thermomicrobiales bacterium]
MAGDQRSIARLATLLERGGASAEQVRASLPSPAVGRGAGGEGHPHVVGISGPPGAGKSSLLSAVARFLSDQHRTVAILAVDPTSPVTGGAMLGDRIRMTDAALLPGVFVRSVAARSRLDGLSPAVTDLIDLFAAAGYEKIIVETVGSGQNQFAVADYVHTLVLVESPGAGDGVQMLKAGIMELADVYVVTKGDLPGAHLVSRELRAMLTLGERSRDWAPAVVLTSAESGEGVEKLVAALDAHRDWLESSGTIEDRRARIVRSAIRSRIEARLDRVLESDEGRQIVDQTVTGERDATSAAELIRARMAEPVSRD